MPPGTIFAVLALTAGYLLFWTVAALLTGRLGWSSLANAATLAASWIVLVLVLPPSMAMLADRLPGVDVVEAFVERAAANGIEAAISMIKGSALSMGIEVVE